MPVIVALSIAIHSCYVGSKVVVSLLALELGSSAMTVGVLAALYAVLPLLLGVWTGRLADRIGMRRPMLLGAACSGVAMLIGWQGDSLAALFVTAILVGAGFCFFNVSIQNLAGGYGRPEDRARNFSLLSVGYSVSAFIGPMVAGFSIDHLGHARSFAVFAAFTLFPLAVLAASGRYTRVHLPRAQPGKRSAVELLRQAPLRHVVIMSGLAVAAGDLFTFFLPVHAHALGLSASTTGVILGAFAGAMFLMRFALPYLLKRWQAPQVLAASMLFAACAFGAFPLFTAAPLLVALSCVIGLGLGASQPVMMALAFERSPPGRTGEVTGLRLTANNVARVSVPLISGALGAALGAAPVFWMNAANLAVISWLSRR
jgi:MFS family permease